MEAEFSFYMNLWQDKRFINNDGIPILSYPL